MDRPEELAAALNPFADYKPLQQALAHDLGRQVAFDACFPFQVESGFDTGWYDFAVVTPTQYARLNRPERAQVVAVSVDKQGRARRAALLVVAADSDVTRLDQLKGRLIAFGPADQAANHHGALRYLESNGFAPGDIARELLPVPGRLRQYASAAELLRALAAGEIAAGFIDEADHSALLTGAPADQPVPGLRLRVLGRTDAYPLRLFLAREKLDAATLARVREFLLHVHERHPQALATLPSSRYCFPELVDLAACRRLGPCAAVAETRPQLADGPEPPRER